MTTIRPPQSPLLQAALDLARQGCSVIPVRQDKRALVKWTAFQQQAAPQEQIRMWFRSATPHGLAIVTGKVSGRVVLDIDGEEGFAALRTRGFDIPPTLQVRTPRGGAHLYFQDPGLPTRNFTGGQKTCPLSQVDFRGDGGYVVAPPSPGYNYLNALPLAPLPAWLKALVIPGWQLVDEAIKTATEGTRNQVGFTLACDLRDRGITQDDAEPLLLGYARAVREKGNPPYTESEVLASLESAYSKPARAPRPIAQNSPRQSQSTRLVELAAGAELFHSPDQIAYAAISNDSHRENWPVRSKLFKQYLARQFFEGTEKIPNASALTDAITVLEGQALFSGPEHDVSLRVAAYESGIALDLCNQGWEVVIVDSTGWRVQQKSPIKFRRSRGMMSLPTPTPGGSVDELRSFLNLADDESWRLLLVWMLNALRPSGPYPVLCLQGEQGAGKTTAVRFIRAHIDPNMSPVRSEPREPRDLMISASNSYLQAFDNLSWLPSWLSDGLCRLSTGGGFATRELFTDQDEVIIDAVRPIILNGIEAVITRSDLLDRALFLTLPIIEEGQRRTEADLLRRFEETRPRIFGALLTALSNALKSLPDVHLDRLPRMADFAIFGTAVEQALQWPVGSCIESYEKNRSDAHIIALDGSPIYEPLEALLKTCKSWKGTASELLEALDKELKDFDVKRRRTWPQSPRQLGAQLSRLAPNLRSIGISVERERRGHDRDRIITLKREKERISLSASSACPQEHEIKGLSADNTTTTVVRRLIRKNSQSIADNSADVCGQQAGPQVTPRPERGCAPADNADKKIPILSNGSVHPRLAALQTMWKGVTPRFETDGVGNGVKPPTDTNKRR